MSRQYVTVDLTKVMFDLLLRKRGSHNYVSAIHSAPSDRIVVHVEQSDKEISVSAYAFNVICAPLADSWQLDYNLRNAFFNGSEPLIMINGKIYPYEAPSGEDEKYCLMMELPDNVPQAFDKNTAVSMISHIEAIKYMKSDYAQKKDNLIAQASPIIIKGSRIEDCSHSVMSEHYIDDSTNLYIVSTSSGYKGRKPPEGVVPDNTRCVGNIMLSQIIIKNSGAHKFMVVYPGHDGNTYTVERYTEDGIVGHSKLYRVEAGKPQFLTD